MSDLVMRFAAAASVALLALGGVACGGGKRAADRGGGRTKAGKPQTFNVKDAGFSIDLSSAWDIHENEVGVRVCALHPKSPGDYGTSLNVTSAEVPGAPRAASIAFIADGAVCTIAYIAGADEFERDRALVEREIKTFQLL